MAPMDHRIVQFYRQYLQQLKHLSYPLPEVLVEASIQDDRLEQELASLRKSLNQLHRLDRHNIA
jgi:hypothetical protein